MQQNQEISGGNGKGLGLFSYWKTVRKATLMDMSQLNNFWIAGCHVQYKLKK